MLADLLSERVALLAVANRRGERGARHSHGARGDVDTSDLEAGEHLFEALALFAAYQVLGRHGAILEDDFAGLDPLVAELVELPRNRDAGTLFDDE